MILTCSVKMPAGKTSAPWIITPESAHWAEDKGVPADVTSAIVAAGFTAVYPKHHLAPPAGNGIYPRQTDDMETLIAWAKKDARCDGRIGAIGGSGGGNLVAMLQAKGLVYAAVALSPATNLVDLVAGGGAPGGKAKNYAPTADAQKAASPTTYLKQGVSTPVMLAFFTTDQMPASQYTDYDTALTANSIDHKSVLLPGAGHSWGARTQVDWLGYLKDHLPVLSPSPSPSPLTITP